MTELIVTLDDSVSATMIKKAISLLKGVKKVVAVHKKVLLKNQLDQMAQLDKLDSLKENWDGEGALPLSKKVVENSRKIIQKADDKTLASWTFSPETNGTLILQKNDNTSCISIGEKDYSAVSSTDVKSHEPFSVNNIVSFIS